MLALRNIPRIGEIMERPKALGDIRGVTYIYGMFCQFGLIEMPEKRRNNAAAAHGSGNISSGRLSGGC